MHLSKSISILLLVALLVTPPLYSQTSNDNKSNPPREYTSWDGRKLNAIFVSRSNKSQTVTLKRTLDNVIFTLPYDKLSGEDIIYIKSLKNPPSDKFNSEFFKLANKFRNEDQLKDIASIVKPYREEILKARPSNIKTIIEKLETMRQKDIEIYKVLSRGNINNHAKDSPSYKQLMDANKAMYFLKDHGELYYRIISLKNWSEVDYLREKAED